MWMSFTWDLFHTCGKILTFPWIYPCGLHVWTPTVGLFIQTSPWIFFFFFFTDEQTAGKPHVQGQVWTGSSGNFLGLFLWCFPGNMRLASVKRDKVVHPGFTLKFNLFTCLLWHSNCRDSPRVLDKCQEIFRLWYSGIILDICGLNVWLRL